MAVDRPTFDESWHRVAQLRPRLRSVVQVRRQIYRGQVWHVYRDPGNNQFFRLPEAGHFFVALLDGRRTVAEAWAIACEKLGDDAPTQGEVIQILGMLYTSNLLQGELPPDAAGLLTRYRKRKQREVRGYLTNLLFARIPLLDPDWILDQLRPIAGWLFAWPGFVLWAGLVIAGLWSLAGRTGELWDTGQSVLAPQNLVWLYLAFALLKLIHEFGHGLACKQMARQEGTDGEVRQMGIMLLVLMPVPFVDATSAWALRSRWRRIFVSAAGMYVEIAAAAVAALVWVRTAEGTLTHALAYNVMFVASVTTLLFNANPLIRFDGYYILSDLVDMPNLYQRSQNYLKYLVKRYVYGVRRPMNPAHSGTERVSFVTYGIASLIYRVFLFFSIFLYVADKLFFIGLLMALIGVVGYVFVPLGKLVHYLAAGPDLMRHRLRAGVATLGFTAAVIVVTGVTPWPDYGRAPGVVEPRDLTMISLGESGFVDAVLESGTPVEADGVQLVQASNRDLAAEREKLEALVRQLTIQRQEALGSDLGRERMYAEQLAAAGEQLAHVEDRLAGLAVHAAAPGRWLSADADRLEGTWQERGTPVGMIASMDDLVVRLTVDQYLGPRLQAEVPAGSQVGLRVDGRPELTFRGTLEAVLPAGRAELPAASLSYLAGGGVVTESDDPEGRTATEPFFEVRIAVDSAGVEDSRLLPGQRVIARFTLPDRPLLEQAWLSLRQLLQKRFQI
ncbi:MAG: hypothetical protein ACLFV3_03485 [Phycisphaeraceae bacterium]